MTKDSRHMALSILERINNQGGMLDTILDEFYKTGALISKRDRSLINAIVFGVLRWQGKLDYIINYFSKRKINKINPSIKNILRMGVYQIIYLSRIPDAAAVHSAVEMAKASGFPWAAGYVNAVLRRTSREYDHVIYPDKDKDPIGNICFKKSMPEWLMKRWVQRFGIEETEALCDSINLIPDISVRVNTLRSDTEKLELSLKNDVDKMGRTQYSHCGLWFSKPKKPISEIDSFANGWFQVQDEAAQLVTLLLDPKPGEMILDSCAGLGGKTGHIAQLMENKGKIIAVDMDKKKLGRLEMEMDRLGVKNVNSMDIDITEQIRKEQFGEFDRILLDAPCTGLGVLRRNPDAKWNINKQNFTHYQKKQIELLNNVVRLLKPSGVLVYTVCSMEPEENEGVVKEFLNNHPDFAIDKNSGQLHGKAVSLIHEDGFFKTYPHKHNMDGFFAVRLKKIEDCK
ncbi:MAG: 16S rRNA (cytosine(967)-C(5))-methyltransferase RsmB [Deltaproteobacteria bacterium]|nr:16S rRNA (cytosine(967)-C(5))-methyltransferase RsmB [Deltaproteobacteria bacterium]